MPRAIVLRAPELADARRFVELARASRTLHAPWVTAPATAAEYGAYLRRMQPPSQRVFLVCRRDDGDIAGVVNVTQIVMGAMRSAYLGYYAFAQHARQGLMRDGLQAVVGHAFRSMRLHRLEANIQPDNAASIALVRACGFDREGYSPRYLKIRGRWRDHERWAIRNDSPDARPPRIAPEIAVMQHLASVALLVPDYDEAIGYYTAVLGFDLIEDRPIDADKRWVLVSPPGSRETRLLLARASTPAQVVRIGDQTGGRVFLILDTDDFERDHRAFVERGVEFLEPPRREGYGTVAVFRDRYGNRWDLLQRRR